MRVSNWNNFPRIEAEFVSPSFEDQVRAYLSHNNGKKIIARGMGRSYGDASLQKNIISSLNLNRFISFDEGTGYLTCESGVSLDTILEFFVPRGWFLSVTPGTKFVSVGGAIASNVHGKNHHKEGPFCEHIKDITLLMSDGRIVTCSKDKNPELFEITCGGMGLTGIILKATLQLRPIETSYINQTIHKAKNLEDVFQRFEQTKDITYSVAWIDCLARGKRLGRSLLNVGEHAKLDELKTSKQKKDPLRLPSRSKLNIPINLPSFMLNKWSIKAFNAVYYFKDRDMSRNIIPYGPFFYPLDGINNWNKMYGKRGFVQYQFVLPIENSYAGVKEILEKISDKGMGSFLAVLKLFGDHKTLMSFPMEGYTLALDFPVVNGLFPFLDELDELVVKHNGRLYLAKDARMKKKIFEKGYPNLKKFEALLEKYDPQQKFQSLLSQRLDI